jgi:hypothetical protein
LIFYNHTAVIKTVFFGKIKMSKRTRTVNWCEGKIIEVLSRKRVITTSLALSALVLKNVRSIDEQHNLDIDKKHEQKKTHPSK